MPSDGHCLFYATLVSINQEFNKSLTYEQMKSDLIEKDEEFAKIMVAFNLKTVLVKVKQFFSDCIEGIHEYVFNRRWATETGDLILSLICFTYESKALIITNIKRVSFNIHSVSPFNILILILMMNLYYFFIKETSFK